MATIGQQLLAPETGWQRIDDNNSNITYAGASWSVVSNNPSRYNNTVHYSTIVTNTISFNFIGTKIRIINSKNNLKADYKLLIDGIVYDVLSYDVSGTELFQYIVAEVTGLANKQHSVYMYRVDSDSSKQMSLDAIDIDSDGSMKPYNSNPLVNNIKTSLSSMQIGDMIPCKYVATSGVAGTFSELGTCTAAEIPFAGTATPSGLFYFIKADKGLLIADRIVQTGVTWEVLNTAKYMQGTLSGIKLNPVMTSNTAPSGSVFSEDGSTNAYLAFNNNTSSGSHYSATGTTCKIGYCFPDPVYVGSYSVASTSYNGGNNSPSAIKNWTFEGSNNGVDYTVLHTATNQTSWSEQQYRTFILPVSTKAYKYYRLNVSANNGSASTTVSELIIYHYGICRSLAGGNSYLDTDMKQQSTVDRNLGAWPPNNEWDKYIVKSTLIGKITAGDDKVWHNASGPQLGSWCQETPIIALKANTIRVVRGSNLSNNANNLVGFNTNISTGSAATIGFRPVLEYPEDSHCSNISY